MTTRRYQRLISSGLVQPLDAVRFHGGEAPLVRRLMAGAAVLPQANHHIAVHEIRGAAREERGYCDPHRHDCAELNLLLSWDRLLFRVALGDEVYTVEAPATIYIPPRLLHSANVVEGTGFYIAMLGNSDYESTFME
ncbi:uncharacterized protein SOCE26_063350 [Sorangium cellulosum]|uniref:AraC-type arabinose-binding/dimerisation domain-containing protein n=1 Tax=Sorangium cellulosum TaxID=56 RepID=A0A2L0F004_SORCE|nr:homocitrate synthase [Sorangium cellulosum]AUX44865.1 uncharacterized protein SOCE26_063350 [Sorangium cellulosum]